MCNKLAGGYGIAGAIASLIPDPFISKVVCAACFAYSGAILSANAYNRGVIVRFNYWPAPVGAYITGIWSQ